MAVPQRISVETSKRDLLNSPDFDKELFEELLTAIISQTSAAGYNLRIDVRDCTESPNVAESVKIKVEPFDTGKTRVTLKIRLPGQTHIWTVDVYLKIGMQGGDFGVKFRKELNNAAQALCDKEAKRLEPAPPPDPTPVLPAGSAGSPPPPPPTRKPRAPRKSTAEIITDEVVLEMLRIWERKTGGVRVIAQRELGEILEPLLTVKLMNSLAVAYLERKGIVRVIHQKQRPQVEITDTALALLEKAREAEADAEQAIREARRVEETLQFPKLVLPSLKKLKALQSARARLNQLATEKAELAQQVRELQREINNKETEITGKEAEERRTQKAIDKLLSSLNSETIARLLGLAEEVKA